MFLFGSAHMHELISTELAMNRAVISKDEESLRPCPGTPKPELQVNEDIRERLLEHAFPLNDWSRSRSF